MTASTIGTRPAVSHMASERRVGLTYPGSAPVIADVEFTVRTRGLVPIVGPSGCDEGGTKMRAPEFRRIVADLGDAPRGGRRS